MKTMDSDKTLLIVNADDFGESPEVNNGIIEAHRNGIVTSVSLMANMSGFEHATSCIKETPSLDTGVHLNVHRGRPLTQCAHITRNGKFLKNPFLLAFRCYTQRNQVRKEITEEFEAQIQRVLVSGIRISHFDTEKHMHVFPFIFNIMLTLAKKYNVVAVRLPYERVTLATIFNPSQFLKTILMTLCAPFNMYLLKKSGIKSPNYFYGVSLSKQFTVPNLEKLFGRLPRGISELSCHPGHEPKLGENYIDAHRTQELATLTDSALRLSLTNRGIVLSSFLDIR